MSRKPSYPKDAAVGDSEAAGRDGGGAPPGESSKRNKHLMTGAAIGIGSAAIVAALLYAKNRRNDR